MTRIHAPHHRLRPVTAPAEHERAELPMRYFPAFLDLAAGRPVLVVGGGVVAWRKVRLLRDAGARVTVVAKHLAPDFAETGEESGITVIRRGFATGDVLGKALAVAATDDRDVNRRVAEAGADAGVPVNVVDDAALSS